MYDGDPYAVSRPRNIGQATLKGVELSSQYFFDFLPGALSGLGLQGAFTIADSKVGGGDPLAGYPLQGVSKYNYTVGLLYETYGISGRLGYTSRSKYFTAQAERKNVALGKGGYVRVDLVGRRVMKTKNQVK